MKLDNSPLSKILFGSLLCLILSLPALAAASEKDVTVAIEKKQFALAIKQADSILASDPRNFSALYLKAHCLKELHRWAEAGKTLDVLNTITPKSEESKKARIFISVEILYELKNYPALIRACDEAIARVPAAQAFNYHLLKIDAIARTLGRQRTIKELQALDLKKLPKSFLPMVQTWYVRMGSLEDALKVVEMRCPGSKSASCYYEKASILCALNRKSEALRACALGAKTTDHDATWDALAKLKTRIETAPLLIQLVDYGTFGVPSPEVSELTKKAVDMSLRSDNEDALAVLNRALELEPWNASVLLNRSLILEKLGKYDKALADAETVLAYHPGYFNAYDRLQRVYDRAKKYQDELKVLNAMIQLFPTDQFSLIHRGEVYIELHQPEKALADLNHAQQLGPSHNELWNAKGAACAALGRFGESANCYTETLRSPLQDPYKAKILVLRSDAYRKLGKFDLAAADKAKAEELNRSLFDDTPFQVRAKQH